MKTAFDEQERKKILEGKQILRHIWKRSEISLDQALDFFKQQGQPLKKSTLSTWLSLNPDTIVRPKEDYLIGLIECWTPDATAEQRQEILDDVRYLLCFDQAPVSSESLRNRMSEQLDEQLTLTLQNNQLKLSNYLEALESLLESIEPQILEYDKGFPVIRLEAEGSLKILRQLLGKEREVHLQYLVEGGYEIPLTKVQSLESITAIINLLNEGSRLLRAYIERHLLEDGYLSTDLYRMEDFVSYCWEISDRLLNHNFLCKNVPTLKRTLLRIMATCWGIKFVLENQTSQKSEVQFQNMLQLKGKTSQADIQCSVAIYMGMLARQYLKQGSPSRIQQALSLYQRAKEMLHRYHEQLNTEQEVFYYKKELANLHYDVGCLLLWQQKSDSKLPDVIQKAMQDSVNAYNQVLETVNLFYEGLTEQRSQHVRAFYVLSLCWTAQQFKKVIAEINKLTSGEVLNQQFWFMQMVKASAYSILLFRSRNPSDQVSYRQAAHTHLQKALLVTGLKAQTEQEIAQDFILHHTFAQEFLSR